MNRPAICCVVFLTLAACGDDSSSGTSADTGSTADTAGDADAGAELDPAELVEATPAPDGFDPGAVPAQPTAGIWTYRRGAIESNSCGSYAWGDRDTPFRIVYSQDGAFVIEQDEPWGDFACFVVGDRFECPRRGADEVPIENTDVVIRYTVRIEGDVLGAEALEGTQHAEVACDGAGCALAPTVLGVEFPCGWSVPFEATFELALP